MYIHELSAQTIYSIGDTHGQGRKIADFIHDLKKRLHAESETDPVFVRLGDLCDCFALPKSEGKDMTPDELREIIKLRIQTIPGLDKALEKSRNFVDWRVFPDSLREGSVKGIISAEELVENREMSVLIALYSATMSFETLQLFSQMQQDDPDHFIVIFGNHDADLLRGHADYGRQQKYLMLGLLGFQPDEVIEHMQKGTPSKILRHPWLRWLNDRPHLAISKDTAYMHGGPTGELGKRLSNYGDYKNWLNELEDARKIGWEHPAFKEHESFLSPDGAPNDWVDHPETIESFCRAAQIQYLAVGHSPFLDFKKGPLIDLKRASHLKPLFHTPAQLDPNGRLIKHDTNLKRGGELWACRHQVGSDVWTAICAKDLSESSLRRGIPESLRGDLPYV